MAMAIEAQTPAPPVPGADPSLASRVVANQQASFRRLENYCFRQDLLQVRLSHDDQVKSREVRDEIVCHEEGVPVVRHMAINGKPTGHSEDAPWPAIKKDEDWRKRVRRSTERRERYIEIMAEVPKAFDFTPDGQETVGGLATIIYRLTPKAGYKAKSVATEMLKHVTGRAWVDPESAQMVRLHAVVEEDFSMWGGLVFKVRKGATYEMRQKPVNGLNGGVNGGAWLPWFAEQRFHARIGIFKHLGQHQRAARRDFRLK